MDVVVFTKVVYGPGDLLMVSRAFKLILVLGLLTCQMSAQIKVHELISMFVVTVLAQGFKTDKDKVKLVSSSITTKEARITVAKSSMGFVWVATATSRILMFLIEASMQLVYF